MNPAGLQAWYGGGELAEKAHYPVPTIRLDTFLDRAGIRTVEFLKIDAQGADLAVVRSAGPRLKDIQKISLKVQINPVPLYAGGSSRDEVVRYLEEAGFRLTEVETQSHGQEENLTFEHSSPWTWTSETDALAAAAATAFLRPLIPYPGWSFGADWDNPDPGFQMRRRMWQYFNQRKLEGLLIYTWHDGLKVNLHLGNDLSRQLFIAGCVEPNELAFLNEILTPGMVFIDGGANDGIYTLFASRRVGPEGQVWAFEPSRREFDRLTQNLSLNQIANVRAFPLALADRNGEEDLAIAGFPHEGQNTIGAFVHQGVEQTGSERIPVRRLDDLVAEAGLSRIDFIKLDVEGAETRAIEGARTCLARFRPIMLFEVLDAALQKQASSRDELLKLISAFNYEFYVFDGESGLPRRAHPEDRTDSMIAIPAEAHFSQARCATPDRSDYTTNQPQSAYRLDPLTADAALFDLAEHQVCEGSRVDSGTVLTVTTSAEQWSYAARFPVREAARAALDNASGVVVKVEAVVESGRIGFGVVEGDGSTYLTPEIEYSEDIHVASFTLTILGPPAGSAVIVRNTAGDGCASKVSIRSMSTFLLAPCDRAREICSPIAFAPEGSSSV